jgi:hypothetical protein
MRGVHRDHGLLLLCDPCFDDRLLAKRKGILMDEKVQLDVARETQQAQGALRELADFEVTTQEEIDFAGTLLVDVKTRWKRLEERRKEITAPMNEALRSANDLFRPALAALADAEGLLKKKIADAQMEIQRKNREAMEAAQRALTAGDVRGAAEAAQALVPTMLAPTGVTVREVWEFRVVDAALVPRAYMKVDEAAIRAAVAAGVREIPGVVIEKGQQVIARTRTGAA